MLTEIKEGVQIEIGTNWKRVYCLKKVLTFWLHKWKKGNISSIFKYCIDKTSDLYAQRENTTLNKKLSLTRNGTFSLTLKHFFLFWWTSDWNGLESASSLTFQALRNVTGSAQKREDDTIYNSMVIFKAKYSGFVAKKEGEYINIY